VDRRQDQEEADHHDLPVTRPPAGTKASYTRPTPPAANSPAEDEGQLVVVVLVVHVQEHEHRHGARRRQQHHGRETPPATISSGSPPARRPPPRQQWIEDLVPSTRGSPSTSPGSNAPAARKYHELGPRQALGWFTRSVRPHRPGRGGPSRRRTDPFPARQHRQPWAATSHPAMKSAIAGRSDS